MENTRKALYNQIFKETSNSPLQVMEFQGNTYYFKLDYKLGFGECHYSRVFAKLIFIKECLGIIKPGDVLLETTSGSGGRAAAAIATALGYYIKIAVPAGGEIAREQAIVKSGGELILTPKEDYVNGFPEFVKKFMSEHPGAIYLNHVMGDIYGRGYAVNGTAIDGFKPFVDEVASDGVSPDVVICPLGNGTTTLPMSTGFKSLFRKTQVVGFEAASSALVYRKLYGNLYEKIFEVDPKTLPRHNFPGTSTADPIFQVPALEAAVPFLDRVMLVTNHVINQNFITTTGSLPKGDTVMCDDVNYPNMEEFGRTGKAGFAVACEYVKTRKLKNKKILIPVFDAAWHYDS